MRQIFKCQVVTETELLGPERLPDEQRPDEQGADEQGVDEQGVGEQRAGEQDAGESAIWIRNQRKRARRQHCDQIRGDPGDACF